MHFSLSTSVLTVAAAVLTPVLAWTPVDTTQSDAFARVAFGRQAAAIKDGSLKRHFAAAGVKQECTIANAAVRRDYADLSNQEKLDYTNAVKCLMALPSRIEPGRAPGAKSRYDDFVAIHINQTQTIHATGNFLAWHRYFTWAFEKALQNECGYKSTVPYWNWVKASQDILNSPYFDGSEFSQGGNGDDVPHNCTRRSLDVPCMVPMVEGRGGGCVTTAPYQNMVVNLSYVDLWFDQSGNGKRTPLSYLPRCQRRDISPEYAAMYQTEANLMDLLNQKDIESFQTVFQNGINLHGVGHFAIGGDPGGELYASPGGTSFWIHHSMVDRVWWMWQNQNPTERSLVIAGNTVNRDPLSPLAQLTDLLNMDYITPAGLPKGGMAIQEHVSTVAGPYCYVYDSKKSPCRPKRRSL